MNLKATLIAGGLAAALGTGVAFAQDYSENPPAPQQAPYRHHHHGHAIAALIQEEVNAGRISQKEGALLVQKIKELKREKRAERQARNTGMQGRGSYGQGYDQGAPPPSQPH